MAERPRLNPGDRIRKAWDVRPHWSDDHDIIFAERAGKARYQALLDWSDVFPDLTFRDILVRRAAEFDMAFPPEHRLVAELSPVERRFLAHAYGSDSRSPGYRNHYCAAPGNLTALRLAWEFGLLTGPHGEREYGATPGWCGAFFYLTELGQEVARSMIPTYSA